VRAASAILFLALPLLACAPRQTTGPRPRSSGRLGEELHYTFTERYGCFYDSVLERRRELDEADPREGSRYVPEAGDSVCDLLARTGQPYRVIRSGNTESWWYTVYDPAVERVRVQGQMGVEETAARQMEVVVRKLPDRADPPWERSPWFVEEATLQPTEI
jgi:hypothetical protein